MSEQKLLISVKFFHDLSMTLKIAIRKLLCRSTITFAGYSSLIEEKQTTYCDSRKSQQRKNLFVQLSYRIEPESGKLSRRHG